MSKQNQTQDQDLLALVAKLTAENDALKAAKQKAPPMSLKVSEKARCISVYGLGRFPINFHASQAVKFLAQSAAVYQFILDNADKLSWGKEGVAADMQAQTKATTLEACRAALGSAATKVA